MAVIRFVVEIFNSFSFFQDHFIDFVSDAVIEELFLMEGDKPVMSAEEEGPGVLLLKVGSKFVLFHANC